MDPSPRPTEQTTVKSAEVRNADPKRRYMLQYMQDTDGYERRLENGWVVEMKRQDGPIVGSGMSIKDGEPIMRRGHVLMSLDLQTWKDHQYHGSPDGEDRGLKYFDKLEEAILDKGGDFDPMRGQGRFIRTVNEIEREVPEFDL
jgi:hypothetical protein